MMKQQLNRNKVQVGRPSSRVRCQCRKRIQEAWRLLQSCGIVFLLIAIMFLLAKGPAYIFFRSEQNALAGLYSQCVHLQADSITADITGSSYLNTAITGEQILLSSISLDSRLREYLEQAGIANVKDAYLRIDSTQPFDLTLAYEPNDGTVRYIIENSDAADIDPTRSAALRCSFEQMQIHPRVTNGDAYESFVSLDTAITVHLPADPAIQCYIIYNRIGGTSARISLDTGKIPGCQATPDGQMWAFTLNDTSLQITSGNKSPLDLEVHGRYALRLSCIGVGRIRGYLTGELLFQNTNTPKNYTLAGQLVDIVSRNNALNAVLCTDVRHQSQAESELLINGEATRMDIAGVDPFPDMRMWFRENAYMAPVSLLSVMISLYGRSPKNRSKTVRPRRIR